MQTVNKSKLEKIVNPFLFKQLSNEKFILCNKKLWILDKITNELFFYFDFKDNEVIWNYSKITELFNTFGFNHIIMIDLFKNFVNLFINKINCGEKRCDETVNFYQIVLISFNTHIKIALKEGKLLENKNVLIK